jgi:hypothetical protein
MEKALGDRIVVTITISANALDKTKNNQQILKISARIYPPCLIIF